MWHFESGSLSQSIKHIESTCKTELNWAKGLKIKAALGTDLSWGLQNCSFAMLNWHMICFGICQTASLNKQMNRTATQTSLHHTWTTQKQDSLCQN